MRTALFCIFPNKTFFITFSKIHNFPHLYSFSRQHFIPRFLKRERRWERRKVCLQLYTREGYSIFTKLILEINRREVSKSQIKTKTIYIANWNTGKKLQCIHRCDLTKTVYVSKSLRKYQWRARYFCNIYFSFRSRCAKIFTFFFHVSKPVSPVILRAYIYLCILTVLDVNPKLSCDILAGRITRYRSLSRWLQSSCAIA